MHRLSHEAAPATEGKTIRWAGQYDLLVQLMTLGRESALRAAMIKTAGIVPGEVVLDVGCGTGSLTLHAKIAGGANGRVCGIDAAPEMIAVARRKAAQQGLDIEFEAGIIEALPFPDETFDVILSSLMFHHLPGDLKRQGLAEMQRVLKPGGRIVIFDLRVPKRPEQFFSLATLAHLTMHAGVDDLASLAEQMGYGAVECGVLPWKTIGYIRARRP